MAATARLSEGTFDTAVWVWLCGCLAGAMLLVGLWTPLEASTQAILEAVLAFAGQAFDASPLIYAMIGLGLLMLGPGGWSIDARLYGRKRLDLGL
jgi:uncharacterized membrane protein YphA (DoxX/SURF4 family)